MKSTLVAASLFMSATAETWNVDSVANALDRLQSGIQSGRGLADNAEAEGEPEPEDGTSSPSFKASCIKGQPAVIPDLDINLIIPTAGWCVSGMLVTCNGTTMFAQQDCKAGGIKLNMTQAAGDKPAWRCKDAPVEEGVMLSVYGDEACDKKLQEMPLGANTCMGDGSKIGYSCEKGEAIMKNYGDSKTCDTDPVAELHFHEADECLTPEDGLGNDGRALTVTTACAAVMAVMVGLLM